MGRRVLFLHEVFPAGGAERVTIDVANYIVDFGYQTYVCSRIQNDFKNDNVHLIELSDKSYATSAINIDFLVNIIIDYRIDIFILPVQSCVDLCNSVKKKTNCKLVFALHSIPFWEIKHRLYEKKKNCRGSFRKLLKWHLKTYPKTVWLKKFNKEFVDNYSRIFELADAYTVLCDEYKKMLIRELHILSDKDKIWVIHNSERRVENLCLNKKNQVLFVGRFTYEDKRIDRLLKIWNSIYKQVSDWELILVGDGPERSNIEKYIEKKRIERVKIVGYTNQVSPFYRDASILCLTSTFEGWPLCLTEAQINGVIPIAFDCSAGIHEILAPSEVNGILVSPFSERQYANKLLNLIQDTKKRQRIQQNVLKKAENYTPKLVVEKWRVLFEQLCN